MTSKKVYSLSPNLEVVVKGDVEWKDDIYTYFGDTSIQDELTNQSTNMVIDLVSEIDNQNKRSSAHPCLLHNEYSFYDSKYGVEYSTDDDNIRLRLEQFGVEWLKWGMQLANLYSGQYFVHSSAVEKDGEAIIFPSWGGVGKTTITSGLVRELDFNLLGDDLNMVSMDGMVYGFPKRMVMYPYHESVFPEVFDGGDGPPIPNMLTNPLSEVYQYLRPLIRRYPRLYLYSRKKNPQSSRVFPSRIFGSEKISRKAKLKTVVWLERTPNAGSVAVKEMSTREIISKIYGSSVIEFKEHCRELTNVATGLGIIDAESLGKNWYDLLVQSVDDVRTVELQIPSDISGSTFTDAVYDELSDAMII